MNKQDNSSSAHYTQNRETTKFQQSRQQMLWQYSRIPLGTANYVVCRSNKSHTENYMLLALSKIEITHMKTQTTRKRRLPVFFFAIQPYSPHPHMQLLRNERLNCTQTIKSFRTQSSFQKKSENLIFFLSFFSYSICLNSSRNLN